MPPQIADTQKPKANADNIDADTVLSCPAPPRLLANLILSRRCMQHAAENIKVDIWQADRQRDIQDALRDCALIFKPSQEFMSSWTTCQQLQLYNWVCVSASSQGEGMGKGEGEAMQISFELKMKMSRVRISNIHCERRPKGTDIKSEMHSHLCSTKLTPGLI